VPLVSKPSARTCRAERLARAASGPDRAVVGPPGETQGEGPSADACEEMALGESGKFVGSYILDAPCVHDARCDMPGVDEVAQPLGGVGIYFVIVGGHAYRSRSCKSSGVSAGL
jgi:hypothetical protein